MNPLLYWKPIVEILILWFVVYHLLLFFEGTRAINVLRGIIVLLLAFFLIQRLDLQVLEWLFTKLLGISVIAILIIFHPEIRQGLARLGQRHIFTATLREEELEQALREISKATESLSEKKIGALIAIANKDSLANFTDSGIPIESKISSELIEAIFTPNNPLHDGGLILLHGRIAAAGCLFPLAQRQELSRIYGTRHRAALGLSEETDAIVIVVSEERQDISLVYKGKIYKDLSKEELLNQIKEIIKLKNA